eukprot:UN20510
MTLNILHLKFIFYIEKTVSKKCWRSKKVFQQCQAVSRSTHHIVLLRKHQKVPKLSVYRFFSQKVSKSHVPMGILIKMSNICQSFTVGVKLL